MAEDWGLIGVIVGLLSAATIAARWLASREESVQLDERVIRDFNRRVNGWWFFSIVVALSFLSPNLTVLAFGLVSFWALREFITLTPTRPGDHRALFWVFFLFTPLQFVLVAADSYATYSILIPVYGFLFVSARVALSGDYHRFLERVAKIQFGLLVCVYCLSFAPALLFLKCRNMTGTQTNARLLFFFVSMVLFSELLQFVCGRAFGKHSISDAVDSSRTWEGLLSAAAGTTLMGIALTWATPFPRWWQTAFMSLMISITSSAGALTVSAIRRERREATAGYMAAGQGGVLRRIDAVCFAAPVFYHVTDYFFGVRFE